MDRGVSSISPGGAVSRMWVLPTPGWEWEKGALPTAAGGTALLVRGCLYVLNLSASPDDAAARSRLAAKAR